MNGGVHQFLRTGPSTFPGFVIVSSLDFDLDIVVVAFEEKHSASTIAALLQRWPLQRLNHLYPLLYLTFMQLHTCKRKPARIMRMFTNF